jgi:hypothetical protein
MDTSYLIVLFGTSCLTTWMFLILFYYVYTNESRLKRSGHNESYIAFFKKDYKKRCAGIAIVLPVLLLTAYSIFWLISGHPSGYDQLIYIFLIFIALVIPFPIMDFKKSKKEYKKLALETGSEVIIDMKYKVLHRFFNPIIEGTFTLLFTCYFLIVKPEIPGLVFLHLLLPWFLYLTARNSKYLTRPIIKEGYMLLYIFITINFLIVLFYLYRYTIHCTTCGIKEINIFSLAISVLLFLKIFYFSIVFIRSRKYISENLS